MADLKSILTDEIRRLARKEVKLATTPLIAKIAELKKQISVLSKELKNKDTSPTLILKEPVKKTETSKTKDIRLNAQGIKRIRTKLGFSQSKFAKLLDVSLLAVSYWELGKTSPRAKQKIKIASLRSLGKKDLKKLCDEKNLDMSPAKRGRKKVELVPSPEIQHPQENNPELQ